jgi:ABC-2 type transport system permease protein
MLIAFCDVILIMVVSVFLFHVPLRGSPWLVLLLALFFLMATLGIGILISATSHTQQLAQTFASMTTQLPTVFLSGFVFPITSMPLVIQWFTYIVPATHFIRILRMVFLKGVGWRLVWSSALFLLAMGVLMVCWSTMAFKKKL